MDGTWAFFMSIDWRIQGLISVRDHVFQEGGNVEFKNYQKGLLTTRWNSLPIYEYSRTGEMSLFKRVFSSWRRSFLGIMYAPAEYRLHSWGKGKRPGIRTDAGAACRQWEMYCWAKNNFGPGIRSGFDSNKHGEVSGARYYWSAHQPPLRRRPNSYNYRGLRTSNTVCGAFRRGELFNSFRPHIVLNPNLDSPMKSCLLLVSLWAITFTLWKSQCLRVRAG